MIGKATIKTRAIIITLAVALIVGIMIYKNYQQKIQIMEKYNMDDIIERKIIFGNPDKALVRLSPDGNYISFVAPLDGVLNVFVSKRQEPENAKPITFDKSRGVRSYFWSYDNKHIIYAQDEKGDENWRLYSVDIDTDSSTCLTPKEGVRAGVVKMSKHNPDQALITLNSRKKELFDVYKLNIITGKMDMIYQNDENFIGYVADSNLDLRYAYRMTAEGGAEIFKFTGLADNKTSEKQLYKEINPEDHFTSYPSHITEDDEYLYMIDSSGRDTASLFKINIATDESELIFENKKADIDALLVNPVTKLVEGAAGNYFRREWIIFDDAIKNDINFLFKQHDGEIEINSRTLDDSFAIVVYLFDDQPRKYYLYDRKEQKLQYLFSSNKQQENKSFAKMHPVGIKTRDGLEMVSYLSLPRWLDDGNGSLSKPIPMVLYVHGGPNARDSWGFDGVHQWLSNRGYAVLSVNYRGSTGFGKNFTNLGNGQWYGKMHDDLEDAVNWAVEKGIAQKDKVAIMGGSYGGYATLVGLTKTPDMFAAGIDIVGPSNLITLVESIPPYWKPMLASLEKKLGASASTSEGREILKSKSPLTYADKISKPLMIVQGANDPRVKKAESDQIVSAMKKHNIPVSYLLYPDEGHGLARPENRFSYYANAEEFLAKFINGRSEPNDGDYQGSTVEFIEKGY